MSGGKRLTRSWIGTLFRRSRLVLRRFVRRVALSDLFLVSAFVVVAVAMVALGNWIGFYLTDGISRGVARTAAASIESLIADAFSEVGSERPITPEGRARLDRVFKIGNEADSTRLLQIRIRDVDGTVIYESLGGIIGDGNPADFVAAASGEFISRVSNLRLQSIGSLPAGTLPVLEIHTPLRGVAPGEPLAVAELYYSARSILDIQGQAQVDVWALVGLAGLAVIGFLYVLVARVSRTIASQRANLARNLVASRRLSEENLTLSTASDRLRLEARLSNERLLAQVGSDLHDGPVQLLALVILRLTKAAGAPGIGPETRASLDRSVEIAAEVMEELRNMSSGLVLPELSDLSLRQAVELAITRHEGATGTRVRRRLRLAAADAGMVIKICAYRVVQEALNNAFWHGDDSAPSVTLEAGDRDYLLTVSNTAPPVDAARPSDERISLGLKSMQYRVESLGGTLRVGSGEMMTITAEIPKGSGSAQPIPSSMLTLPVS